MPSVLSPLIPSGGATFLQSLDCRALNGHGGALSSDSAALQMAAKLRSPAHHHPLTPPPLSAIKAMEPFVPSSPSSPSTPATPLSDPSVPQSPERNSAPAAPPASTCSQPSPSSHLHPASASPALYTQLPPASLLGPAQLSSILQHSARSSSPSPPPLLPELSQASPSTNPSPEPQPSPSPSPSPVPFVYSPVYPDDSLATRQLKFIYRVYHHVCDIYFAVDKGHTILPSSPSTPPPLPTSHRPHSLPPSLLLCLPSDLDGLTGESKKRQVVANPGGRKDIPDTVSPGYGELARSGFDKVIHYLCEEAPEWMRMDSECRFLDIGSGFGKCVLHAKVRGGVKESAGIEFIPVRHEKAAETLHYLRARFVPGLTDGKSAEAIAGEAELMALMNAIDLEGVQLIQGDITDERHHHLLYRASHIYMFDVVFSDVTMQQILPLIERSNFALFACYHRPQYLERMGCHQFVCIHKMAMKTTGKQSFTCYFYVKSGAGTRVTRTRERLWAKQESRKKEDTPTPSQQVSPPKKRKLKPTLWYKRRRQHLQQEEKEEDEHEEGQEEAEEEMEEEKQVEVVKPKVSHKSRGIRHPRPAVAPSPSALEPPRPRQLTHVAAESLAFDAFTAMISKSVAAFLVAEQDAASRREARDERRMRRLLKRAQAQADEAIQQAMSDSLADVSTAPLVEQSTSAMVDQPPSVTSDHLHPLLPRLPPASFTLSPSAVPSSSAVSDAKPLSFRAQRLLEVEAARKVAIPLLLTLLPQAVSAAATTLEKGQRTSPTLLLDALEQPLDCLAEPVPASTSAPPPPSVGAATSAPTDDDDDDQPLAMRHPRYLAMKMEETGAAPSVGKRKSPPSPASSATAGPSSVNESHKVARVEEPFESQEVETMVVTITAPSFLSSLGLSAQRAPAAVPMEMESTKMVSIEGEGEAVVGEGGRRSSEAEDEGSSSWFEV